MGVFERYEDVPEIFYVNLTIYRGTAQVDEIGKPLDPSKIPSVIYVLKSGADVSKPSSYVRYEVQLKEEVKRGGNDSINDDSEMKRERILNLGSIVFHFLNFSDIKQDYSRRFSGFESDYETIITEFKAEVSNHISGGVSASLNDIIEGFFKSDKNEKITSLIGVKEREQELKFIEYQKARIDADDILLNLELKTEKSKELLHFEKTIEVVKSKYLLSLNSLEIENKRKLLGASIVNEIIKGLSNRADKHVIVNANFIIQNSDELEDYYLLSFLHPLSEKTEIKVFVKKEELKSNLGDTYSLKAKKMKSMNLYVYGSILSFEEEVDDNGDKYFSEIEIRPIAIYST